MAKMKNLDGFFEVKNVSYTYSLFKRSHSMENKVNEYGIILSLKYKLEQTEVIYRLLFTFLLRNYKKVCSDRTFTFSLFILILLSQLQYHELRKYSSNQILKA